MEISENIQKQGLVMQFFVNYNNRKIPSMLNTFCADAKVVFIPFEEGGWGNVQVLGKVIWESLIESFPDINHTVRKIKVDAYGYLICKVNIKGTQAKDFPGIRHRGLSFDTDFIYMFHFNEQAQIDYISVNWDNYEWRRQLGAV